MTGFGRNYEGLVEKKGVVLVVVVVMVERWFALRSTEYREKNCEEVYGVIRIAVGAFLLLREGEICFQLGCDSQLGRRLS